MLTLSELPDVRQVQPFHFYDAQHKPTKCDLLVNPAQGWAIATTGPTPEAQG
jgi:hypothetical protein